MNYYAVNNDSRSLSHHGIKGMKWGIIRTDAQLGHPKASSKPRSSAYLKAKQKLSEGMKKGIEKAKDSWREYNAPENKEYRAYKKSEKLYQKHLQQARKGKLKYKNVKSDDELYRITERLNSERASRALSNAEQGFISRFKTSVGEGLVQGAGKGASAYVEARFKGRGETDAAIKKEKRMAAFHNSLQGRIAQSRENRYEKREAKAEEKRDYKVKKREEKHADKLQNRKDKRALKKEYKTMVQEDGADYRIHGVRNSTRRKRLAEMKDKRQALEDKRQVALEYSKSEAKNMGVKYGQAIGQNNADREIRARRLYDIRQGLADPDFNDPYETREHREGVRERTNARMARIAEEQARQQRLNDVREGRVKPKNREERKERTEAWRNDMRERRRMSNEQFREERAKKKQEKERTRQENAERAEQQRTQERLRRAQDRIAERERSERINQAAERARSQEGISERERFDRFDSDIERPRTRERGPSLPSTPPSNPYVPRDSYIPPRAPDSIRKAQERMRRHQDAVNRAGQDLDDLTRRMMDRQNTSDRRKKRSKR